MWSLNQSLYTQEIIFQQQNTRYHTKVQERKINFRCTLVQLKMAYIFEPLYYFITQSNQVNQQSYYMTMLTKVMFSQSGSPTVHLTGFPPASSIKF